VRQLRLLHVRILYTEDSAETLIASNILLLSPMELKIDK
jgi:hypothetical protein